MKSSISSQSREHRVICIFLRLHKHARYLLIVQYIKYCCPKVAYKMLLNVCSVLLFSFSSASLGLCLRQAHGQAGKRIVSGINVSTGRESEVLSWYESCCQFTQYRHFC